MEDKIYCSACGEEMTQGYNVHDGLYHYCSDKCLYEYVDKKDYNYLYKHGFAFWTTFDE